MTIAIRYEIGDDATGETIDSAPTFALACDLAVEADREPGRSVVIYDRMARRGLPCLWSVYATAPRIRVLKRRPERTE